MVKEQYEKEGYTIKRSSPTIIFTDKSASVECDPDDIPGWYRSEEGIFTSVRKERE